MLKTLVHLLTRFGFGSELSTTEGFTFVAVTNFRLAISYNERLSLWVIFKDNNFREVLFQCGQLERVVSYLKGVRDGSNSLT